MTRDFARHKLAESVKGSFENQEKLVDELNSDHKASEQAEMSAIRRKIQLQETVEADEVDEELKGRSIASGERLQKTSRGCGFLSLLSRRCDYGKRAIAKWTWFFVDYTMPK